MLAASRPSVREAISMLETLGILRVEVGKGAYVSAPPDGPPTFHWRSQSRFSLREVYQFRAAIEPAALAHAAGNFTTADLAALRASAEALWSAAGSGNAVAAAEEDARFHELIFERCGNRIFRDIQQQMRQALHDSQWVPMVLFDQVRDTAREHLAIIELLEKGDAPAACHALERHIQAAAGRCGIHL